MSSCRLNNIVDYKQIYKQVHFPVDDIVAS